MDLFHSLLSVFVVSFLLAAAWLIPGGTLFSQLNKGVKDATVVSTELVIRQVRMTKTCKKAIFDKQQQSTHL